MAGENLTIHKIPQIQVSEITLPRWFAVYTTPRHEKRIAEHFGQREIESYLPLYRTHRRWKDGSNVTLELPLFQSYIFVRIGQNERVRVLEVPGVQRIIGSGNRPAPLPDFEIESLRADLHKCNFEPHPFLAVGDRARIKHGAMAGMEGFVVRTNNSLRIVLTLDLIMRSVAVEVESANLEFIGPAAQRATAS
jgi:transcription antitermination factor NusG